MKHAINELKALLDTWGPQKEADWSTDINRAVSILNNFTQDYAKIFVGIRTSFEGETNRFSDEFDLKGKSLSEVEVEICEWIDKTWPNFEKARPDMVKADLREVTEWHNDPEVAAVVEHGIGKEYASTEYGASPEQIRVCSERNQSEAIADIEAGRAERIGQNYPVAAVDPAFDKGRVVYGYHTNGEFIQLGEREFNKAKFHVFENRQELERFLEEDNLGELDPSKACGFGEEGCSSCQ